MSRAEENRKAERFEDDESGIGVALWQPELEGSNSSKIDQRCRFIGIHNHSEGGMMVESPEELDSNAPVIIKRYLPDENQWEIYEGEIAWSRTVEDGVWQIGLHVRPEADMPFESDLTLNYQEPDSYHIGVIENFDFFINLPLLQYLPRKTFWALLNCLVPVEIESGSKLINQGDEAKSLFIIEKGRGRVRVDKNGEEFTIAQLGPHDLVGEMAVLTGEPRNAHFTAMEDMLLWELDKDKFELAMARYPDLRTFLTELVSRRLENSSTSADRQVGKYIAKHKLGAGAWAIVYQGVHGSLNKTVAIKMLKHQMAMDEEFSSKFLREAEIIANINHPNIVHVYDIEDLYATHFIVMEYLEGESLEQLLKRVGRLTPELTVHYLLQICSGLDHAHQLDIIHQDIKPDNILIQKDDTIKILDFGLACPTGSENFEMEGTIQYMSPEQIDSYPVDARTDIYCMGITAFEMIAGQRPYPDDDLQVMMDKRLEEDIPDPAETIKDIPERLSRFIRKACAREKEERFQNVREAIAELEICAEEMGLFESEIVRRHMSSLFLFYTEEQRTILAELLDEFSDRAAQSGIRMQLADFENITSD
ncbi:MAG: protein kinase [Desulfofustis sp.]|nr:protein kinase [Desulfofustis sp.]